jgi:uroporphyrin-III C-methyltransferase
MSRHTGMVYLVGAGPGDPELLTVKALRLLQSAEVVLYDRLVAPEVLALANPDAEFIYSGKDEGHQEEMQQEIYALLLRHALAGRCVVRLKGGDPFIFGRGAEEMQFLRQHRIQVEVVPGITSAVSVPALAGIPVTFRGIAPSMTIVSARCKGGTQTDWERVAGVQTLVILMGVKYRASIADALIRAGRSPAEPAAFIERGSTPEQRVIETTLEEIAGGNVDVDPPAVFVVGEVVRLRSQLLPALDAVEEWA